MHVAATLFPHRPQIGLSFYLGFSVFLNHYLFSFNFGIVVVFLFLEVFGFGVFCSPFLFLLFVPDKSLLSCRDG
jgi:hypothetical protein